MATAKRLVIKFGTEVLLARDGQIKDCLDQCIFTDIARQVVAMQDIGVAITIVSSGAIQAGRENTRKLPNNAMNLNKKELAGIGSRHLLNMWGTGFEIFGKEVAQVWVTYANWTDEGERRSILSSIINYHKHRIIPIVNENDVVSDNEIKLMEKGISENDRLARMVAELINADAILFLTKSGGAYEEDPIINPRARLYAEIDIETAAKIASISRTASPNGSGGMGAKLHEAALCAQAGMQVAIAGIQPDVICKFAMGEPVGTIIGTSVRFR